LEIAFSRGSPKNGLRVPKARECSTTETRLSGGSPPHAREIAAITSVRFASSAALTLKNSALRPLAAISATIRSAFGCGFFRCRWTPKMFQPAFARAIEQASPKPDEEPRTRAHRERVSGVKTARMLARQKARARGPSVADARCKLPNQKELR
jgi:hypothetical protein